MPSYGMYSPQVARRFWSKVERDAPDKCWKWLGAVLDTGYGQFTVRRGNNVGAHRVAWMLSHGDIPGRLFVCHACDNRRCVNPGHLFLGTTYANMRDANAKGRHAHGERHGNAKLTERQVMQIRLMCDAGVTHREIAQRFGISPGNVWWIRSRIGWSHV